MKYLKEYNEFGDGKFYHGSPKKLDTLKLMQSDSGESKFLGEGIYINNSQEVASSYTNGGHLYEVTLLEPLSVLQYFENMEEDKFTEIYLKFQVSSNSDISYIGDNMEEELEDEGTTWWGKYLIAQLERYELDVNNILLEFGYNAIEAPINKINQFIGRPDSDRNINVIKDGILSIKPI